MILEECSCPLGCEKNDRIVLKGRDRLHDLPGEFFVVQCKNCGLMRTNPRPDSKGIGMYYPDTYGPYQEGGRLSGEKTDDGKKRLWRLKSWLGYVLRVKSREIPDALPGAALEIGCSNGDYMEALRSAGWDVDGVEFSEHASRIARSKGFSVWSGQIEDYKADEKKYDAIIAWMVIEHLHEPNIALDKMRQWTKDDGFLAISVPDAGSLERALFGERWYALHLPNHLFHFTPRTISRLLRECGWDVDRIIWHRNPSSLLKSVSYLLGDKGFNKSSRFFVDFAEGRRLRRVRLLLGVFLGFMRQSGRMTIWARPASK